MQFDMPKTIAIITMKGPAIRGWHGSSCCSEILPDWISAIVLFYLNSLKAFEKYL